MRKKVRHYIGKEITEDIIKEIDLISKRRKKEGLYTLNHKGINTLEEMCYWHDTKPSEENVVLGEDWYIIYSIKESETEILEWLSLKNVPNKMEQTIEMLNEIKKILLINKKNKIVAYMRHVSSYQFYQKFLSYGYLKELHDSIVFEQYSLPKGTEIYKLIEQKYGTLEAYLEYLEKNPKALINLEKYIYHDVEFEITDKFIKRSSK